MFPLYTPWVDIILRLPRDASWTPCIFLTKSCSWWDASLFLSFSSYLLEKFPLFPLLSVTFSNCESVRLPVFPRYFTRIELHSILPALFCNYEPRQRSDGRSLLKICSQNREGPPSAALLEHTSAPLWWFFDARFPSHPIIPLFYCQACEASI